MIKTTKIMYWIFTAVLLAVILFAGLLLWQNNQPAIIDTTDSSPLTTTENENNKRTGRSGLTKEQDDESSLDHNPYNELGKHLGF